MKKVIHSILILFIISIPAYSDNNSQSHIIENVNYHPMLDGYCAMTALRMNLEYYGFEVEQSLLLNLGWDYGFFFMSNPFYTIAYPDTDPVEEIVFAAKSLGFKADVMTHESLNEAKETLVKYISQDKPVLVQWIPHTVLAYGYKNTGSNIIYHDPAKPGKRTRSSTRENFPIGLGEEVKMDINEWLGRPQMWAMRQFQMVVIEPDDKKHKINWQAIWKRNAEKTLGLVKNDYPGYYGIAGLQEMLKSIEAVSAQNNGQEGNILENLEMTFEIGVGFRRDAAAFLAGQASLSQNLNLSKASSKFLDSAHLFNEGMSLLRWFKKHPEKQSQVQNEIIQIVRRIIDSEKSAAEFLLKACE
jgi:hypothetical protein